MKNVYAVEHGHQNKFILRWNREEISKEIQEISLPFLSEQKLMKSLMVSKVVHCFSYAVVASVCLHVLSYYKFNSDYLKYCISHFMSKPGKICANELKIASLSFQYCSNHVYPFDLWFCYCCWKTSNMPSVCCHIIFSYYPISMVSHRWFHSKRLLVCLSPWFCKIYDR